MASSGKSDQNESECKVTWFPQWKINRPRREVKSWAGSTIREAKAGMGHQLQRLKSRLQDRGSRAQPFFFPHIIGIEQEGEQLETAAWKGESQPQADAAPGPPARGAPDFVEHLISYRSQCSYWNTHTRPRVLRERRTHTVTKSQAGDPNTLVAPFPAFSLWWNSVSVDTLMWDQT